MTTNIARLAAENLITRANAISTEMDRLADEANDFTPAWQKMEKMFDSVIRELAQLPVDFDFHDRVRCPIA